MKLQSATIDKYSAPGARAGTIDRASFPIPAGGLAFYERKGIYLRISGPGQAPVWLAQTQVRIDDGRRVSLSNDTSRSPSNGLKSASPGLIGN